MNRKSIFLAISLFAFFCLYPLAFSNAEEEKAPKAPQKTHKDAHKHAHQEAPNEKYKVIGDLEQAKKTRPVEVVKIFNYSCGHCYRFFKNEKRFNRFGDKIDYKKVPIFWGKQSPYPTMAYYYAIKNGKEDSVHKAIFEAHFESELDVFSLPILNQILLEQGLPISNDGMPWTESPDLKKAVDAGMEIAQNFDVHETPSIVINGAIKVMPSHTKGNMTKMVKRVEETLADLLR